MKNKTKTVGGSIFFGASITLLLAWLFMYEMNWDGVQPWTFSVTVLNATTNMPVPSAQVSVIVKNEYPFGDIESFYKDEQDPHCITDISGKCTISAKFNSYGTRRVFYAETFINFKHRSLRVRLEPNFSYDTPLNQLIASPQKIRRHESKEYYHSEIVVRVENATATPNQAL